MKTQEHPFFIKSILTNLLPSIHLCLSAEHLPSSSNYSDKFEIIFLCILLDSISVSMGWDQEGHFPHRKVLLQSAAHPVVAAHSLGACTTRHASFTGAEFGCSTTTFTEGTTCLPHFVGNKMALVVFGKVFDRQEGRRSTQGWTGACRSIG